MSEQPEPATDAAEPAPRGRGRRRLVLVVALVLGLVAGGVGFAQFLGGGEPDADNAPTEQPVEGAVLTVATLTSSVRGDAELARVGLAVVTVEGAAESEVVERFPLVQDAAVSELARTPATELRTARGADALRRRLTRRAQDIYPDGEVLRVLLTELVVQ